MRCFEFGDLAIVPDLYHVYMRSYLVFYYKIFGYYKLWVPSFTAFIKLTQAKKIMELCSGAGDPLKLIVSQLDQKEFFDITYILSDIQPHQKFIENFKNEDNPKFHYLEQPIDATKPLPNFNYPKIFINSFHHLSPSQVELVLQSNYKTTNEIIIMEYVSNSFLGYFSMLCGTLVILPSLPFIVKLKHLPVMALFTYIVPLFPLMVLWDGIVSCLHVYSENRLQKLISKLGINYKITNTVSRSIMYPAGVSTITLTLK